MRWLINNDKHEEMMMSSDTITSETLIYEKKDYAEGSVVTLTLNKPHTLNALNIERSREIDAALDKVEQDDDQGLE